MGLCPIAPPKGFPNVYGGFCRIALWKPSGKNTSFFLKYQVC